MSRFPPLAAKAPIVVSGHGSKDRLSDRLSVAAAQNGEIGDLVNAWPGALGRQVA